MNTGPNVEVVLDTNVLVSAALSDSKPYQILTMAERRAIVAVTSPGIVAELDDVLRRDRLPFTDRQVDEYVGAVLSLSRVVEPEVDVEIVDDDPDDDKIVECAVAADADCIVSGDSHLLDLGAYEAIRIESPTDFVDRYRDPVD